jgi:hypothetical protein
MPESLRVCHDRLLPADLVRPQQTIRMGGGASRAIIVFRKLWINGSKLHVRFMGGTPAQQAITKEQAQWWAPHANLTFEFDNVQNAEIRIAYDASDGAWSFIGTDAASIPPNQPTMNLGFLDGGTPAHEFGHAIGLAHEHPESGRGDRVERRGRPPQLDGPAQ